MGYFSYEESPIMKGYYVLRLDYEKFGCKGTSGSYQVMSARLLNVSYANYLRLCRDEFGAELYRRNCLYVTPYFGDLGKLKKLIGLLEMNAKHALALSTN